VPDDQVALIREQLKRLRARPEDVGPVEGITVADRSHGNVVLQTSPHNPRRLDYFKNAEEILERLRGLPDDAGPEGIHSEFA
jgi:hypothetical protein